MMDDRIAAVVVNHDTREHMLRCLDTIVRYDIEAIVVDTGSNDGSADAVQSRFPAVEVLRLANRGYGAGVNAGIRQTAAPYALVLNADTRLVDDGAFAVADYLDRHPRAAVAGPLVVDCRGQPQITARRFPSPLEILLQESGLHSVIHEKRSLAPRRVDWILGAALALRRHAVLDIGGFDESYFMYNEEVDLCLRLDRSGWETHYAPVTTVEHVGGASTSQQHAAMTAQYVRSTMLFAGRHLSPTEQRRIRAIFALALAARVARDRARLALVGDGSRRRKLEAELEGWQAARAALAAG
jgi:GT2 family glycosyltransferase